MKTALRWIATPFAAVLGSFVLYAIVSLMIGGDEFGVSVLNGGVSVAPLPRILGHIFAQAVCGFAFVLFGAYTAPSKRIEAAVVLAAIATVVVITGFVLTCMAGEFGLLITLHNIATIAGACYGVWFIQDTLDK